MNRIITILVTIFILLLLYIWISHVWGSDNPRRPNEIVDARQDEMGDGLMADADTTFHTDITESPSEEPAITNDEFNTDRKAEGESVTDDNKSTQEAVKEPAKEEKKKEEPKPVPAATPEKSKPVTTNNTPPKTTTNTSTAKTKSTATKPSTATPKTVSAPVTSASSTEGKHLVIAGNFSQLVNAQQRADELKRAGFKNTEIINFDLSEYHTVCVGRYSDVNDARKLVKKLKDYHKIDAYVRIGG
jgi:cell division protein FtsN